MTIKPTMDTTIMSTLVTGMLKLHRISGDSKGPIIAQAHNNNDNGCSGLDPDLSPPPPVLWLCLATGPRPVTDFSSGSSQCLSGATTRRNVSDVVTADNDER